MRDAKQKQPCGQIPSSRLNGLARIPEGHDVTVDATLTPLGEAIMVDATIHARLQGECVRCLKTITPDATLTVSQVFATTPDFVMDDPDNESETEAVPLIQHDTVDLLQSVIDEAGITS